jgi:hypothetical protein
MAVRAGERGLDAFALSLTLSHKWERVLVRAAIIIIILFLGYTEHTCILADLWIMGGRINSGVKIP